MPRSPLSALKKLEAIDPNYLRTPIFLGMVYTEKGIYEEAIAEEDKANTIQGVNFDKWAERDVDFSHCFLPD